MYVYTYPPEESLSSSSKYTQKRPTYKQKRPTYKGKRPTYKQKRPDTAGRVDVELLEKVVYLGCQVRLVLDCGLSMSKET